MLVFYLANCFIFLSILCACSLIFRFNLAASQNKLVLEICKCCSTLRPTLNVSNGMRYTGVWCFATRSSGMTFSVKLHTWLIDAMISLLVSERHEPNKQADKMGTARSVDRQRDDGQSEERSSLYAERHLIPLGGVDSIARISGNNTFPDLPNIGSLLMLRAIIYWSVGTVWSCKEMALIVLWWNNWARYSCNCNIATYIQY